MHHHPNPQPITRLEWLIALLVALATVALTLIPYTLAYLPAADGLVFTGVVMNPEDSQTYLAKIFQGYQGQSLYTIPFTPEPHTAAFVGVFYLWLGHLARVTGLTITAVWHLSRIFADMILFLTTFAFICQFFTDRWQRWTAYLLALFGSGLGWFLFLIGQPYWLDHFPVDFKQPGAHLFFTAFTYPHIALGTAFILMSIWILWQLGEDQAYPEQSRRSSRGVASITHHGSRLVILAGLVNTALGIAYPFLLYIIMVIAALYWLYLALRARRILWQKGLLFAGTFAIPAPLYLYYAYTLQINAVFKAWDEQAATPSPPWPHYLVAYGPMLLLAFLHWRYKPEQRQKFAILWLWLLAVALLLYAPLNPQRRFVQGVHVALAILSTAAFCQLLLPHIQQTKTFQRLLTRPDYTTVSLSRFVTFLFLLLMSLSNIYILGDEIRIMLDTRPYPFFRPADEIEATAWLRENGEQSAVLIGDYQTANYIAAQTPIRVMLGHWAETVAFAEKEALVTQFYQASTSDTWRRDLIRQYHIRYVWHGPRERLLGDFDPESADYLQSVYSNSTITIFATQP
jgi:hypothetical protein